MGKVLEIIKYIFAWIIAQILDQTTDFTCSITVKADFEDVKKYILSRFYDSSSLPVNIVTPGYFRFASTSIGGTLGCEYTGQCSGENVIVSYRYIAEKCAKFECEQFLKDIRKKFPVAE